MNFDDTDYQNIISDILNDTFYIDRSIRGKLAGIRQYSEILIRKILDIDPNEQFMLGKLYNPTFKEKGEELLGESRYQDLIAIVDKIKPLGNAGTHTQYIENFTEAELNLEIDHLFDLLAFFFIEYFIKYPMDSNTYPLVLNQFSLLPPIIRYKTLLYHFDKSPNAIIADRLSLAVLKTFDKEYALAWLDDNKGRFLSIEICALPFNNSFELALDKINLVGNNIIQNGKPYETFEQAKTAFLNNKINDSSSEIVELLSIMDFVYLGRNSN
ncbi:MULTISPECIES: hypothetical protein [Sporosarcina]|uniref:hypothetical protein n=1 Tax=Sporosarcina TaxID=1569 RepID=UPI000A6D1D93|nr:MULTISPECIES: hypothetical protein [Sporosarcina]